MLSKKCKTPAIFRERTSTGAEHDKLKEDFRTLVRLQDDDEPSHGEVTQKTKSVPNIPNLLLIGRSNRQGSANRKPSVVLDNLF
jgi:hypothetical protein